MSDRIPSAWQSRNDQDWREIVANVDGGYGDDGSEFRWNDICVVDEAENNDVKTDREIVDLILASPDLREACEFFLAALTNGDLVRNVSRDADPDYAVRMIPFVEGIAKAQKAVDKSRGR